MIYKAVADFVHINTSDVAVAFAIWLIDVKNCKCIHKPRSFIKNLVAQLLIIEDSNQFEKNNL